VSNERKRGYLNVVNSLIPLKVIKSASDLREGKIQRVEGLVCLTGW